MAATADCAVQILQWLGGNVKTEDIKAKLCTYDPRSPYFEYVGDEPRPKDCACDCCFYGKTQLAEYALELKREISELKAHLQTVHSMADLRDLQGCI